MTLLERTAPTQARTPKAPALPPPALGWQRHAATWIVFVSICLIALFAGLQLRRWTWDVTKPIRFGDIYNGFKWGDDAAKNGYLNLYERMKDQQPNEGEWLDYAPLRLLVMRQWGLWARIHYPDIVKLDYEIPPDFRRDWPQTPLWNPDLYEFTAPVLRFNTLMEAFNAIGVFLLVRLWVVRGDRPAPPWKPWQFLSKYHQKTPRFLILVLGALLGAWYAAALGPPLATTLFPVPSTLFATGHPPIATLRWCIIILHGLTALFGGLLLGAALGTALSALIRWVFEMGGFVDAPWKPWQYVRNAVTLRPARYLILTLGAVLGVQFGAPVAKALCLAQFTSPTTMAAATSLTVGILLGAALGAAVAGLIWHYFASPRLLQPPACPQPHVPFRGFARGLIAALLVWFNPAMILSAHGWPTWDMWIIPFYIWAILFASLDWWFTAGLMIAIGAMFKGQQLFVAPIFILWPLLLGRPGAALRWIAGMLLGIGAIASPWMLSYPPNGNLLVPRVLDHPALYWVLTVTAAVAAIGIMRLWLWWFWRTPGMGLALWRERLAVLQRNWHSWPALAAVALAALAAPFLILWPWFSSKLGPLPGPLPGVMIAAAALLPLLALCLPLRRILHLAAAALGAALLLCMLYFHGSHAWADCGWLFGTKHWVGFVMGMTSNLPGLLQLRFGWYNMNEVLATVPHGLFHLANLSWPNADIPLTVKPFFFTIFVITLLLATFGIAFQARRNSPRFLVAITTPWLLFFCIPCQIHERYLLFAAAIGIVAVGESFGMGLLAVFLSLVTWVMTIHVMLNTAQGQGTLRQFMREYFTNRFGPKLHTYISQTHPDIAWAVLLCAVIYLYISLTPGKPRLPRLTPPQN